MTDALPDALVATGCDCRDLDGFMLNVERLMASELVALSSHEVIGAALFLWCRAWKQQPAASLPDDDRVIAAFARLPLPRFRKLKPQVMRGFVKCSDGRLYHSFLAAEAARAFERKNAFRTRRETDAKRLREWRATQKGNANKTPNDTHSETADETRFVAEGQGQGQGQVLKKEDCGFAADLSIGAPDPDAELFRRGKAILGSKAGGQVRKLKELFGSNVAQTRTFIEDAAKKENPCEYVAATIKRHAGKATGLHPQFENGLYDSAL